MSKVKLITITVILSITGILFAYSTLTSPQEPEYIPSAQESTAQLLGGDFSLINHDGQPVTQDDYKDQYKLIYFGYTFCPDVCPTDLQIMTTAYDNLPDNLKTKVTPLFVTVDPDRDTVDIIREYSQHFHNDLIGLTGSHAQINAVKKAYRVYSKNEEKDEYGDYLVSHSAFIYVMDQNNYYLKHFSHNADPEKITQILNKLIR